MVDGVGGDERGTDMDVIVLIASETSSSSRGNSCLPIPAGFIPRDLGTFACISAIARPYSAE